MGTFKGICTDYVSEIDKLFHSPDRPTTKPSPARDRELAKAERIARLRDGDRKPAADVSAKGPLLWEDF